MSTATSSTNFSHERFILRVVLHLALTHLLSCPNLHWIDIELLTLGFGLARLRRGPPSLFLSVQRRSKAYLRVFLRVRFHNHQYFHTSSSPLAISSAVNSLPYNRFRIARTRAFSRSISSASSCSRLSSFLSTASAASNSNFSRASASPPLQIFAFSLSNTFASLCNSSLASTAHSLIASGFSVTCFTNNRPTRSMPAPAHSRSPIPSDSTPSASPPASRSCRTSAIR